ncbi:MAG: RNA-binding protein [Elusimicrobiota bacterium]
MGSLPFDTTEDQLKTLFGAHGAVASVKVITDRDTGRSKGFAFVEMTEEAAAQTAIQKMNGTTVGSRSITVNEARPMEDRGGSRGGFGGGGRGGYGGNGGGGGRNRY